ncbi:hypothetical protein [Natronobeatus ordinarius]|uniref:hypothetical protein n=1 Tax=Natronobeatus ordinarius TaxID=2963433 RepID=UPI0020CB8CFA|nr:hypothetical protein [Natronobeatus ordinarius]
MRRRQMMVLLGCSSGLSGCLSWQDEPEAFVDNITLQNTSDEPVDLELSISETGSDVFTETVSLSERYGEKTNVAIWEPVTDPGRYTIRVTNDDRTVEINTIGEISRDQPRVFAIIRWSGGSGFVTDVYSSEEKHTSSTK